MISSAATRRFPKRSRFFLVALSAETIAAVHEADLDLLVLGPEMQDAGLLLLGDELKDVGDAEVLEGAGQGHGG